GKANHIKRTCFDMRGRGKHIESPAVDMNGRTRQARVYPDALAEAADRGGDCRTHHQWIRSRLESNAHEGSGHLKAVPIPSIGGFSVKRISVTLALSLLLLATGLLAAPPEAYKGQTPAQKAGTPGKKAKEEEKKKDPPRPPTFAALALRGIGPADVGAPIVALAPAPT